MFPIQTFFQVQDGLFGTPYGLYTGSSAFENELGVQPPVGFWDPLGFTKTDDALSFRRRRYVELKHGRVAMFACLGYIVPVAASFMKRNTLATNISPPKGILKMIFWNSQGGIC